MQFSTSLFTIVLTGALQLASATQVVVNNGCIIVNGQRKCRGDSLYETGTATSVEIHARFESANRAPTAWSGCGKVFTWPPNYSYVYFGNDNCLYDGNGLRIDGQCCEENVGRAYVPNPYSSS